MALVAEEASMADLAAAFVPNAKRNRASICNRVNALKENLEAVPKTAFIGHLLNSARYQSIVVRCRSPVSFHWPALFLGIRFG